MSSSKHVNDKTIMEKYNSFWIHSCKGSPQATPPSRSTNNFTSIDVSTGPINGLSAPEQTA